MDREVWAGSLDFEASPVSHGGVWMVLGTGFGNTGGYRLLL